METKELVLKTKLLSAKTKKFSTLEIKTEADYQAASGVLSQINALEKEVKAEKDKFVKPLNDLKKTVDSHFKPIIEHLAFLKEDTKNKMLTFVESNKKKEAKIMESLSSGKISIDKAIDKIENIPTVSNTRTVEVVEIFDESKLPRKFLVPDLTKIKDALKDGQKVPGARLVDKTIIVAR